MAMAKKKLNVEEIIELLKASYDGMPNFTPILNKGTIDTLYEINEKTVHSPEISTGYYGFCKKSEIVSELNRLFCELLLDIRANGDLHQHRRTEITRENGIERTRSYYNDVVKAWLYQFSRTNHPVEYKDKIIEINLQPETSAYTPEITSTVEQPSHFFPVDVNPSKPKNAHEVVILMESYGTTSTPENTPATEQPEAFKINPDLAPDFDAAFDECSYSPDYQANHAVFDDEPQSRRLVIRRRPAPAGRKLPTPKSRRQVYDFSKYADADTLRKALNAGDINTVKAIAESYREFQPHTDGKAMTKTDYVTAIVKLYFPDYQPKAPTQEAIQDFHGIKFTPGKIYVLGSYYDIINNRSPRLFKVIRRNKSSIVIQEISNPDFMPAIGTECKTIKTCNRYPFSEYISFSRYSYDNLYAYWDYDTIYPYSPGYDIDFDETAYTPERQDNLAVLDDIPADHEPDTQKVKITPVQEVKPVIIAHPELQPLSAEWDLLHAKFAGECTDIDVVRGKIRLANTCINLDTVRAYQEAHAQHVPVEAKTVTTPAKTSTKLPRMERCPHCGSLHKPYFSYRKQNNYSYTRQHFGSDPSEWTVATLKCRDCGHTVEEYFEALYGQPFPSRQEAMKKVIGTWSLKSSMADKTTWKFKPEPVPCVYISDIQPQTEYQSAPAEPATVSKSAPKPATKKPRHTKKLDTSRQILIQFDEPENTPVPVSTPAKPKTRRTRTPRIKRDYSRQILIDFGKDIPDCQNNKRIAA